MTTCGETRIELDSTERLSVRLRVFVIGDNEDSGFVTNLSQTGCQLQGIMNVERGSYLVLHVMLGDGEERLRIPIGAVRWSNGFDCGIEFLMLSKEERARLRAYLLRVKQGLVDAAPTTPPGTRETLSPEP